MLVNEFIQKFLNVMSIVAMASVEGQKASAFSSLKKVKTINKTLQLKPGKGAGIW